MVRGWDCGRKEKCQAGYIRARRDHRLLAGPVKQIAKKMRYAVRETRDTERVKTYEMPSLQEYLLLMHDGPRYVIRQSSQSIASRRHVQL